MPSQPTRNEMKLLPCPFCGGEAIQGIAIGHPLDEVICDRANCPGSTVVATVEEWNKRACVPLNGILKEIRRIADENPKGLGLIHIMALIDDISTSANTRHDLTSAKVLSGEEVAKVREALELAVKMCRGPRGDLDEIHTFGSALRILSPAPNHTEGK